MKKQAIGLVLFLCTVLIYINETNNKHQLETMKTIAQQRKIDNSNKSVLARGCDPVLSIEFSKIAPSLLGNASYIPTTNDVDFVEKLISKKWSVVYFAPGACRFSAAKQQIPGGNMNTAGWTLEEYKELIYKLQGEDIKIVETPYEDQSIELLNETLKNARAVN